MAVSRHQWWPAFSKSLVGRKLVPLGHQFALGRGGDQSGRGEHAGRHGRVLVVRRSARRGVRCGMPSRWPGRGDDDDDAQHHKDDGQRALDMVLRTTASMAATVLAVPKVVLPSARALRTPRCWRSSPRPGTGEKIFWKQAVMVTTAAKASGRATIHRYLKCAALGHDGQADGQRNGGQQLVGDAEQREQRVDAAQRVGDAHDAGSRPSRPP